MGLRLIPHTLHINFVGMRKISYMVSLILLLAGAASLIIKGGPRYGIDFAGGAIVQVKFDTPVTEGDIKNALGENNLPGLVVQSYGSGSDHAYLIRVSSPDQDLSAIRSKIETAFKEKLPGSNVELQRTEFVGPKVGADLRSKAVEAMYFATLLIAIYMSGRFEQRWLVAVIMAGALAGGMYLLELIGLGKAILVLAATLLTLVLCWKLRLIFALGAVACILHDLLVTIGLFSIMDKEFDLTIIAALLTVIGYSLNDTIIVYDRIRENLHIMRGERLAVIINKSINQTLSRTVLTAGTTLLVVVALLVWGGGTIHDFSLVMFIGILIGTASSIFVASPILLFFGDTVLRQAEAEERAKAEEEKKRRAAGKATARA